MLEIIAYLGNTNFATKTVFSRHAIGTQCYAGPLAREAEASSRLP